MKSSRVVRRLRRAACEVESLESRWLLSATVTSQISTQNLLANQTPGPINLTTFFHDPVVTGTAVVLETNEGNIPLVLTDSQTPNTVANFVRYINANDYNNTIIHRSVPGFVIQGGGYTNTGTAIPSFGSINGEHDQSNITGSIAMALSSGPNSATNEWFINLANNNGTGNTANLDNASDGGPFTAFGNIVYNGLAIANAIAALPIVNDTGQGGGAWSNVPIVSGTNGATVNSEPSNNLVSLTPVILPGGLSFSVVSSNTGLVTATVNSAGSLSLVTHSGGGTATITVTATDMGGGTAQSQFTVDVTSNKLAFAAPVSGSATAGATVPTFSVDVEDSTGTILNTDNSNVTLTYQKTGSSTIFGSTNVNAVNGVATFSGITLNSAGSYTFTATDGGLSSVTSGTFAIAPAVASKLVFASTPANTPAGNIISPAVVVDVEDQFGNIVNASDNVTVAVGSGPTQTLNGTLTVAAVNGVATFNSLTLNTTGAFTLTATDGTENNVTAGTSGLFTIGASVASKLGFSSQPTSGTAGVNLSPNFTVNVEDAFGSTILTDSSLITLSYHQTGTGGLTGTLDATAIDGVATFGNLEFNRAGNYIFTATDGTLASVTSSTVTVNSAAETKLVFATSSSPTTAGAALNPVVDVEDQFGNIVTGSSDHIMLSAINSKSLAVVSTATAVAVNGVANFTGFTLDNVANYSLTANDTTNTNVTAGTSAFFAIGPAAPAKLVFGSQPTNITAGVMASPAFVVDVEDAFGNLVPTDNSPISVALASGGKSSLLTGTLKVTADNGAATFSNVLINSTGTFSLAATQGSLHGTSANVVVNPLPAKLVFANQPNSTLVGAAINTLTVYAEDSHGQVVSTDDANITITIQSGAKGATLGGTFSAAAVNGTATFAGLNILDEGSFTLKASENTSKIAGAISHAFTLTPKIIWSEEPAASVSAGATIVTGSTNSPSLVVELVGANDQPVVNAGGPVKVSLVGSGKLLGTTTVTAKNGVATFSNLSLDTTGTFMLKASNGSLTPGTSTSFQVNPTSPVKLAFAPLPTIAANSPATIHVDVEDKFGNIVTSDSSTPVTLTLSVGTAAFGPVNDVNGVATFTNVQIAAGTYKLNALAANRTPAISKPITVK